MEYLPDIKVVKHNLIHYKVLMNMKHIIRYLLWVEIPKSEHVVCDKKQVQSTGGNRLHDSTI